MDNKPQKINCHFISNTHWDREWRFSARRTQYMLGYMLDMLTDILDKYPEYRHFHLDSQNHLNDNALPFLLNALIQLLFPRFALKGFFVERLAWCFGLCLFACFAVFLLALFRNFLPRFYF